jgi:branched-chain amino acid transport system substrate-binding protein
MEPAVFLVQHRVFAGMKNFYAFLATYAPDANKNDFFVVYGYAVAQTMVKVLQQCGDDLTRANVMKQAANLTNFTPDVLLPGISISTGAADFAPVEEMRMVRLKGEKWELFGDVISADNARK